MWTSVPGFGFRAFLEQRDGTRLTTKFGDDRSMQATRIRME
jgi:hypothetical protein